MSDDKKVKLDRNKSRFAKQSDVKHEFEAQADKSFEDLQNQQKTIMELGFQFLEILKDKTLSQNKMPNATSLEREVLSKMTDFAMSANQNQYIPEGMGSVSLITLLFKSALIMRDNYNQMEYRLEQLEKQFGSSARTV